MSGGDSSLKVVPTNYGKKVKILNIYPPNGRYLKDWLSQNNGSDQPVNMGLIEVDEVLLSNFNANPNGYLKVSGGTGLESNLFICDIPLLLKLILGPSSRSYPDEKI